MTEQWRPVPGYEGLYEVSDEGRVKRLARATEGRPGVVMHFPEEMVEGTVTGFGYHRFFLTRDGRRKSEFGHVLVLSAFVGPRPAEMEACHGNGVRLDNRLVNLRWDTRSGNQKDAVQHGTHASTSRTHCPQGHPYDDENTIHTARGSRNCRPCGREASRRYAERKGQAA